MLSVWQGICQLMLTAPQQSVSSVSSKMVRVLLVFPIKWFQFTGFKYNEGIWLTSPSITFHHRTKHFMRLFLRKQDQPKCVSTQTNYVNAGFAYVSHFDCDVSSVCRSMRLKKQNKWIESANLVTPPHTIISIARENQCTQLYTFEREKQPTKSTSCNAIGWRENSQNTRYYKLTYKHKKEFTVKFLKISEYVREKKSTEHWLKYNKKQNNNKNTHRERMNERWRRLISN